MLLFLKWFVQVGLLFMSFQAKLKQFETIQQLWSNSTRFPPFHLRSAGRDPIIGQAPNQNEGKLSMVKIFLF
jgi:hypothetical protein